MPNIYGILTYVRECAASLEEFSRDADYFRLLRPMYKILFLFSVKSFRDKDESSIFEVVSKVIVQLYRVAVLCTFATVIHNNYWIITQKQKPMDVLVILNTLFCAYFITIIRIALLNINRTEMTKLIAFFNDRSYQEEDTWVHRRRVRFFHRFNRVTMGTLIVNVLMYLHYICVDLVNQLSLNLQYKGEVVGSFPVQMVYSLFIDYIALAYAISFCVIHGMMRLFRMELTILLHALRSTASEQMDRNDNHVREDFIQFQRKFYANIRRHAEIIQAIMTFNKIFSPFALIQYYGSMMMITYCCFITIYEHFSIVIMLFEMVGFFLAMDTFMLCRCLDEINDLNAQVGYIAYGSYWPITLQYANRDVPKESIRSMRRSIMIVLMQSQQPLRLGYGSFGVLSSQKFTDLVQTIYTMITFLTQIG